MAIKKSSFDASTKIKQSSFDLPKYVNPTTLDKSTQPTISAPQKDSSWYGKTNEILTGILNKIPSIQDFSDPTGLRRKEALVANPITDQETQASASRAGTGLFMKQKSGVTLTPEEQQIKKIGEQASAKMASDLVLGFMNPAAKLFSGPTKLLSKPAMEVMDALIPRMEEIVSTKIGTKSEIKAAQEWLDYFANVKKTGWVHPEVENGLMNEISKAQAPAQSAVAPKLIPSTVENVVSSKTANIVESKIPAVQAPLLEEGSPMDYATDIYETAKTNLPQDVSLQETILKSRAEQDALLKSNKTAPLPDDFPIQAKEVRSAISKSDIVKNIDNYSDIGNAKAQFRDVYRNTEQIFKKDFPIIDETILTPFDQSKGAYIDMFVDELKQFKENVPFKVKSQESKFLQRYGEGKTTFQELIEKFGKDKAEQIVQADTWMRNKYDELLSRVNEVEQIIYPNSPYKWTPKRKNYYRGFQEVSNNDFSRLQNILENPIRIDPLLAGISDETLPKSKWASFKQRRFGANTAEDAVGGYLNYLKSANYAINIDQHIGKFRELADTLARGTGINKNLNNYIASVRKFADSLAGKTSDLDRIVTQYVPGGRTTLSVVDWVNNRVKANTILGSASASLAQIYNLPIGVSSAGKINSAKAILKTLGGIFFENKPMAKSTFLKERYFKGFNKFDKGILNNSKKFAQWFLTVGDEISTKLIWNAQYEKGVSEGISNIIKYADDATRKIVGGRGIGEKPLIQNSKVFQVIAPFQLEVTNLWWAMEDMAKSNKGVMSKFNQFATLLVALYLTNNLSEYLTGNRTVLDPIKAVADGIDTLQNEPDLSGATKAGGRLFGEVLSNIPLGQNIASVYPEFGTTIAGVKVPTRKELFGRNDPTRFGGGLMSTKALSDPLFKILPPFGGGQLKKTIEGVSTYNKGMSTTPEGRFKYGVEKTPSNLFRGAAFGQYSFPEAKKYYNKKSYPKGSSSNSSGSSFD